MAALGRLEKWGRVEHPWWLACVACTGAVVLGHLLRQLDIVFNPLAWSSAEIISALLSITIAASVLVRYYGTGNRISLFLGLTFAVTGVVHLGAIFEFYNHLSAALRAGARSILLDDRANTSGVSSACRLRD